jgi:uncharacterized protein
MTTELEPDASSAQFTGGEIRPTFAPVAAADRVGSVDVLRGTALLGILAMNIYAFALPWVAYNNPLAYGTATGIHFGTWVFTHLLFDLKFMTIFSMLFGAGLVLMNQRAESTGRKFRGIYYRRMLWLLLIGACHAYFLWYGDILFPYAICGLLLYPLRRRSPKLLIALGAIALFLGMAIQLGGGFFFVQARLQAAEADAIIATGGTPTEMQTEMKQAWEKMRESFAPPPEKLAEEVNAFRGSYAENIRFRAPIVVMMHTQAMVFMMFWRIAGVMLLGMGLMKLGVFAAERSRSFYLYSIIFGYGLGLSLIAVGITRNLAHDFDFVFGFKLGNHFNYVGSILVALGHVGVVMLACKSGILSGLRRRLAAVGQMALTNYLSHTLLLTPIFYGFGLGLFGSLDRFWLMFFVLGVWLLQLIISPIWLRHFRFGPAEWAWRSLTYWKRQPLRITATD